MPLILRLPLLILAFFAYAAQSSAQENKAVVADVLPAKKAESMGLVVDTGKITHPILNMTPDKSELIRLDGDISTVIVGNPAHINVLADSARTLVVVPREPGASHFVALDKQGNIIMQRHVIVAAPKNDYVRIRRSCNADSGEGCQNTSVYYCPNMCHNISIPQQENQNAPSESPSDEDGESTAASNPASAPAPASTQPSDDTSEP